MIYLAFKKARGTRGLAGFWSRVIARKTRGPYSHVELWLSGPPADALCFSSREGHGVSFQHIDLSNAELWDTVLVHDIDPLANERITGFCLAMNAACIRYDYLGILGIATGHGEHNDHDRFCSEVCMEVLQVCAGRWPGLRRWMISPSDLRRLFL